MSKRLSNLIATVFGLGLIPFAPGTWGSLAGLGLCVVLHGHIILYSLCFAFLFVLGVISSGITEKEIGTVPSGTVPISSKKDPPFIVIDEFAAIFLVYLFIPLTGLTIVLGFVLYRLFDILKIPPARLIENLKGGWGIMLDDIISAIYANLILHLVLCLQL